MHTAAAALIASCLATSDGTFVDRFAGSSLELQTSANLNTFAPRLQQSANRTVDSSLLLAPAFDAGADVSITALLAVLYEWTNSDTTRTLHEPVLSDLVLSAMYGGLPALAGIQTGLGAILELPTSKASQARTMYFTPGLRARASRAFELPGGQLALIARGTYKHPVYRFSTPGVADPPPYAPQCFGGAVGCFDQASGVANVRDQIDWRVIVESAFSGFSSGLLFSMSHRFPYVFRDLEGVARTDDPVGVRVVTYFSTWVGYRPLPWLNVQISYAMLRNVIGGSGGYENPIFDPDEDMRLALSLGFSWPQ